MLVGIDVAKDKHYAFFGTAQGKTLLRRLVFENNVEGFWKLLGQAGALKVQNGLKRIVFGMEPTANYHKPLGEHLIRCGHLVVLVSGVAACENRDWGGIPGFGRDVSAKVLGAIGDPFRFQNGRQVMKLSGLDLSAKRSGKSPQSVIPVISRKGKADLRYALYQAALIASVKNPDFIEYYTEKLRGREKEPGIKIKVRVKLAAKLLLIAWTLMKKKGAVSSGLPTDYRLVCFYGRREGEMKTSATGLDPQLAWALWYELAKLSFFLWACYREDFLKLAEEERVTSGHGLGGGLRDRDPLLISVWIIHSTREPGR